MKNPPPERIKRDSIPSIEEMAIKLRSWDVLRSLGVTEVFGTDHAFYLRGPALRLEVRAKQNIMTEANESFAKHFGIPIEIDYWEGNRYRTRSTSPQWFEIDRETGIHISAFLEGIRSAINTAMADEDDEKYEAELIVEPGYPWPGRDVEYFSAKEKKWYRSLRPDAVIQIENSSLFEGRKGDKQWAINFCDLLPTVCQVHSGRAVIGDINGIEYMVTHASGIMQSKVFKDHEDYLKKCGGMVFPSLATGEIPAANFGEAILVAHPGIILPSLVPYKQRSTGAYPIVTYDTDVWTETARAFVNGPAAVSTFKQLYGGESYMYWDHFYILGPTVKEVGMTDVEAKMIKNTKQLRGIIARRAKAWHRGISQAKFDELSNASDATRYGYLESKSHVIVDWKCFVLAATPVQFLKETQAALESFGYTGDLIGVEVTNQIANSYKPDESKHLSSDERNYLHYQYSWAAADAIRAYAHENHLVMNVGM